MINQPLKDRVCTKSGLSHMDRDKDSHRSIISGVNVRAYMAKQTPAIPYLSMAAVCRACAAARNVCV